MRLFRALAALLVLALLVLLSATPARAEESEWQSTFSAISKLLDNNDSFSRDGRFLVYDTRDTVATGIGGSIAIMKVSVTSGLENFVYAPTPVMYGTGGSAPGLGAASFSPLADEAMFIHGPLVSEVPALGLYGKRGHGNEARPLGNQADLEDMLSARGLRR